MCLGPHFHILSIFVLSWQWTLNLPTKRCVCETVDLISSSWSCLPFSLGKIQLPKTLIFSFISSIIIVSNWLYYLFNAIYPGIKQWPRNYPWACSHTILNLPDLVWSQKLEVILDSSFFLTPYVTSLVSSISKIHFWIFLLLSGSTCPSRHHLSPLPLVLLNVLLGFP